MKLPELFQKIDVQIPDAEMFGRRNRPYGMPPLKFDRLKLKALIGDQRENLRTPTTGIASLLLKYKERESSVVSLDELNDGEEWRILQVQGARTRRGSYRVACSLEWQKFLGESVKAFAKDDDAEVRLLTMPPLFMIENIDFAVLERIGLTYQAVQNVLGMRWSDELGLFVTDVYKNKIL